MLGNSRIRATIMAFMLLVSDQAAMAGSYDAICGNIECKIKLDGNGLTGPLGYIPANRIAQWHTGGGAIDNTVISVAGATGAAVGGALAGGIVTCWTLVLCPVGLLAGGIAGGVGGARAGRSANVQFTIIGYNQAGKKIIQSFNFSNTKPANRMHQELTALSGLRMGELRTVEMIKDLDKTNKLVEHPDGDIGKTHHTKNSTVDTNSLPEYLDPLYRENMASTKKAECWKQFIQKPGMATWINANPKAAQRIKSKYSDC